MKEGLRPPCCLCVCISPLSTFDYLANLYEPWYVYHGTWAHLSGVLHKSLPSVCVCMCIFLIVARQWLDRHVPMATNRCRNRRKVGVIFYMVHVISKDSLCVCLRIPLSLLGNGSVNTLPQQQIIAESVIFYAIHIALNKSRQLISSY
jgi:hypothetical protein